MGDVVGLAEIGGSVSSATVSRSTGGRCESAAGVLVRPGSTALQRMPRLPCEVATERVIWMTAALEAA